MGKVIWALQVDKMKERGTGCRFTEWSLSSVVQWREPKMVLTVWNTRLHIISRENEPWWEMWPLPYTEIFSHTTRPWEPSSSTCKLNNPLILKDSKACRFTLRPTCHKASWDLPKLWATSQGCSWAFHREERMMQSFVWWTRQFGAHTRVASFDNNQHQRTFNLPHTKMSGTLYRQYTK